MKYLLLMLCIIGFSILTGCKSESILGKWKGTKKFNASSGKWDKEPNDTATFEFMADGSVVSSKDVKAPLSYTIDKSVTPHRILMSSNEGVAIQGVYQIEDNKLLIKSNYNQDGFPTDIGIDTSGKYVLIECERQ